MVSYLPNSKLALNELKFGTTREFMKTKERIIEISTNLFADAGYQATSLDDIAAELGNTKQAILYHFGNKEALLIAVIDNSVTKLTQAFEKAISKNANSQKNKPDSSSNRGDALIEEVVKSVFLMATANPDVLGILREVLRLGGDRILEVRGRLEPYMLQAQAYLEAEMKAGKIRKTNPHFLLLATYSTVLGVANEVELLRATGVQTSLREVVNARKELLEFLRGALNNS